MFEDDKIVVVGNDFKIEIRIGNQPSRARIARFLNAEKDAERVGVGAPVYLVAVLEYLAAEISVENIQNLKFIDYRFSS
ncbi:unnamed protein product [Lactuca virosa]|uniref:Uncharacterized protein n=1 Tax=Lactuca virosa TaxID=75947 RepID=A0AAU9MPI8_9ASTR|nr:unnamed protein product [Lactuca virosa]